MEVLSIDSQKRSTSNKHVYFTWKVHDLSEWTGSEKREISNKIMLCICAHDLLHVLMDKTTALNQFCIRYYTILTRYYVT